MRLLRARLFLFCQLLIVPEGIEIAILDVTADRVECF